MNGELFGNIKLSSATWQLEEGKKLIIDVVKAESGWWKSAFVVRGYFTHCLKIET